jgi:hypothetical protein
MADRINKLLKLKAHEDKAVGEVLSVNGFYIDIFIYPEFLEHIRIGDIIAVSTDWGYAIGPVLETSYKSQRSFRALKINMDKIRKAIPDIYKFHLIFTRIVYTSHFDGHEIIHVRGATPLLHSLAYKLDSNDILDIFFGVSDWKLEFVRTYVSMGADTLIFRHFIETHKNYLRNKIGDKEVFIRVLSKHLARVPNVEPSRYLIEVHEAMGW